MGRDARAHPRALPEGDGGGLDDDAILDAFIDLAATFEEEQTEAAQLEREVIRTALDESITKAIEKRWSDPDIAEFRAYVPNGGIKTNRDNEWVLTLHVAWADRLEISRIVETIPMTLDVKVQRVHDE